MNPLLRAALLERYPRAEYALLEEVCEDVIGGKRRADAMVLNFWASRGRELQGFEVKSHRSDWLREMKDPSKAEALARFCDRWWIIDDSEQDAVKREELPPTWGLLVRRGKKLVQVLPAAKLTPVERPWSFVCSLIRRAQGDVAASEQRVSAEAIEEAKASLEAVHKGQIDRLKKEIDGERKKLELLEPKIGVSIDQWTTAEQLEAALQFIRAGGVEGLERRLVMHLRQSASSAEAVLKMIEPLLEKPKEFNPEQAEVA